MKRPDRAREGHIRPFVQRLLDAMKRLAEYRKTGASDNEIEELEKESRMAIKDFKKRIKKRSNSII